MKKVNCIIIEDEFPAVEILKGYLDKMNTWNVLRAFDNALDAIAYLSHNKIDVIFLDIQLPELNGIDFIKSIDNPPLIVITSAYNEHAVEAFELVVFDYLLKPYSFQRFIKTAARIDKYFELGEHEPAEEACIYVKEDRKNRKIFIDDIVFIESLKEYVRIVCEGYEVKTKLGISKIEVLLCKHKIIRVHRSFMVSLHKINSFTHSQIVIHNHLIPIGRYYQREVLEHLN